MAVPAADNAVPIPAVQRVVERRVANPLLRAVLRSPIHGLARRWVLLVSYRGRKSGRRYSFPAMYVVYAGSPVVVTPRAELRWWRHFEEPHDCRVWLQGRRRHAVCRVLGDEAAVEASVAA